MAEGRVSRPNHGEFDSACPGYCVAQDTFYVGTLKGVGRIYQQTAIDTYAKVAFARLGACPRARHSRDPWDRKTPITAADLLNDRVLTDRGTEFCGRPESHDYELYLAA